MKDTRKKVVPNYEPKTDFQTEKLKRYNLSKAGRKFIKIQMLNLT